jgi:hypothetical protein
MELRLKDQIADQIEKMAINMTLLKHRYKGVYISHPVLIDNQLNVKVVFGRFCSPKEYQFVVQKHHLKTPQ